MFDRWGLAALYVAATREPEPKALGSNAAVWWLRVGTTASYADTISRIAQDWHPNAWRAVWFRVWTPSKAHASRLQEITIDALALLADAHEMARITDERDLRAVCASRHETSELWLDVGPDFATKLGLPEVPSASLDAEAKLRRFDALRAVLCDGIRALAAQHVIETWDDAGVEHGLARAEAAVAARDVGRRPLGSRRAA
jgi:hypothetical protein